jgi:putative transposase
MGTKRSLLVDGRGIPLSLVVSGAQRHDVKLLEPTLAARVVRRPRVVVQHLCADRGYAGKPAERIMKKRHYIPHVRQRGEEIRAKRQGRRHPARRWVVERTHSWLNRFRKLLVRFEKLAESHQALLEIACALIVFRQCIVIHG